MKKGELQKRNQSLERWFMWFILALSDPLRGSILQLMSAGFPAIRARLSDEPSPSLDFTRLPSPPKALMSWSYDPERAVGGSEPKPAASPGKQKEGEK